VKFTLRSVDRDTGRMTPLKCGTLADIGYLAAYESDHYPLCDFAVTKNVPAKRLYGDIEPGVYHIITLERWSKGKLIYKKEKRKPYGRPEDR